MYADCLLDMDTDTPFLIPYKEWLSTYPYSSRLLIVCRPRGSSSVAVTV